MHMLLPTAWLSRVPWARSRRFVFHEVQTLRDGELELIAPAEHLIDAVLASAQHTLTRRLSPELANTSRRQLREFLSLCPHGRQAASGSAAPAYHFWMRDHSLPDLPIAGGIALRVGTSEDVELYYGHVGYHVYAPHRGRHFAERAVRLLLPLARRHGINPLWITCNPDNWPSLRTCQRLGAELVQTIVVPPGHPLYLRGEVAKCRFRLDENAGI